ncbi:hypothetical protein OROHE_019739 [Orobanche hederae]
MQVRRWLWVLVSVSNSGSSRQSEGEIWTAGFANGLMEDQRAHCRNFESCHMAAAATSHDLKRFWRTEKGRLVVSRSRVRAVISRNLIHMSSDEKNKEEDLNFLPLLGKKGEMNGDGVDGPCGTKMMLASFCREEFCFACRTDSAV